MVNRYFMLNVKFLVSPSVGNGLFFTNLLIPRDLEISFCLQRCPQPHSSPSAGLKQRGACSILTRIETAYGIFVL